MSMRKIGLVNYLAYGSGDFLGAGTTALTAGYSVKPLWQRQRGLLLLRQHRVCGYPCDRPSVAGLGRGGINYVPWNIYTYIADVDEVVTGQRREGIFAGIMTLTRKASQAGAVMLVGIVMQMSGFVSGQTSQVPGVSHTILMILSVGTVLVLSIGFLVSLRFRLNLATHSVLREETAKMRSAGRLTPESITPQARQTVEMLAGMPYEKLWDNNDIGYINRQKARDTATEVSAV